MCREILSLIRKNSRMPITQISRLLNLSRATTYNRFKQVSKKYINNFVSIIHFDKLGYSVRTVSILKAKNLKGIDQRCINSASRLEGDHILIDCYFKNNLQAEKYIKSLLKYNPRTFHIVEEIISEEFLTR